MITINKRSLSIWLALAVLLAAFAWVVMRSGSLLAVEVTVAEIKSQPITPSLFGIGTIEARYRYLLGPTVSGRIKDVFVDVGDAVTIGQAVARLDSVDLSSRLQSIEANIKRAHANLQAMQAQAKEAEARLHYAQSQAQRYRLLSQAKLTSDDSLESKQEALAIAQSVRNVNLANVVAAEQDIQRLLADRAATESLLEHLELRSTVNGLVVLRNAEPGSTVIAGQPVVELIDTDHLWINARFDQARAQGLRTDLPVEVTLRARAKDTMHGKILRIEPLADAVTEELLAKVVLDTNLTPLPSLGELAEVQVSLPGLPAKPVVTNAALKLNKGQLGVWKVKGSKLEFVPVTLGASNLQGQVQVLSGLQEGDLVVLYSKRELSAQSHIQLVDRLE